MKRIVFVTLLVIPLALSLFLLFGFGNSLAVQAGQAREKVTTVKPLQRPAYQLNYARADKQVVYFSGRVVSNLQEPVNAAAVEINGETVRTDSKGFFRIVIRKKDDNRFVMNIRKEGFGLMSKIYRSSVQNKTWIMTKATTKVFDPTRNNLIRDMRGANVCLGSLSSRVDWSRYPSRRIPRFIDSAGNISEQVSDAVKRAIENVENARACNPGISISIPANSLVDSSGNPPQGEITASISTVDIYDPDSMPGDYTVRVDNGTGYMLTYGAGTINLTSKGETWQLKKGKYATVEIPINPAQLRQEQVPAPEVPFLLYGEKEGTWRVVGKAALNEKRDAYVARIAHLSTMNMDLVKTNQSCVRIDSRAIDINYMLEVTVPGEQPRTDDIDNTASKFHAIFNLPSNTDIVLRAFRPGGLLGPVLITDTIVVNTGNPQSPQTPNSPVYPYDACNASATLTSYSSSPLLTLYSSPNSTGQFTLRWEYAWTGLASTSDGYTLEKSTTSSTSDFTLEDSTAGGTSADHTSPKYHTMTRTPGVYYYRVKAVKNSIPTPYSNVVQVTIAAAGARQLKITNGIQAGAQGLDSSLQVKIIAPNTQFTYVDLLTDDTDTDGTKCFDLPGEEIAPGASKTFDIAIGDNYWVFIGLGTWDLNTGTSFWPGLCSWSKPWAKRRYFLESGTLDQYWPWIEVQVTGHAGDVWEWTITGSYVGGDLYLNLPNNPSMSFNITNYDPIP
jgi:hypothetical protein